MQHTTACPHRWKVDAHYVRARCAEEKKKWGGKQRLKFICELRTAQALRLKLVQFNCKCGVENTVYTFFYHNFNIEAERHFSAMVYGKGPCDGVGGSVKRLSAHASLQRPYKHQILTHHQLFECTLKNISNENLILNFQLRGVCKINIVLKRSF